MFIGHAALAFILSVILGKKLFKDSSPQKLLAIGLGAAFFATLPDIDIANAFFAVIFETVINTGGSNSVSIFWEASQQIHRKVTHSLIFGFLFSFLFFLIGKGCENYIQQVIRPRTQVIRGNHLWRSGQFGVLSIIGILSLVGITQLVTGFLGATVLTFFAVCGVIATILIIKYNYLTAVEIGFVSLIGLLSHPFGDFFTGTPPHLLYPLPLRISPLEPIPLFTDPTVNLLSIFVLELAIILGSLYVFTSLINISFTRSIQRSGLIAIGYGATVMYITPPTLSVSYQMVLSVVSLGILLGCIPVLQNGIHSSSYKLKKLTLCSVAITSVVSILIGVVSYGVLYLSLF